MKSFVTGGAGFLGSAVVQRLVARGDEVVGLARSDEGGDAAHPSRRPPRARRHHRRAHPRPAAQRRRPRLPHRRRLPRRHQGVRARGDVPGQRGRHHHRARRRDHGEGQAHRLRLHRRRVRQHARQGRRRDLRAAGPRLPELLRRHQVHGAPRRGRAAGGRRARW